MNSRGQMLRAPPPPVLRVVPAQVEDDVEQQAQLDAVADGAGVGEAVELVALEEARQVVVLEHEHPAQPGLDQRAGHGDRDLGRRGRDGVGSQALPRAHGAAAIRLERRQLHGRLRLGARG